MVRTPVYLSIHPPIFFALKRSPVVVGLAPFEEVPVKAYRNVRMADGHVYLGWVFFRLITGSWKIILWALAEENRNLCPESLGDGGRRVGPIWRMTLRMRDCSYTKCVARSTSLNPRFSSGGFLIVQDEEPQTLVSGVSGRGIYSDLQVPKSAMPSQLNGELWGVKQAGV